MKTPRLLHSFLLFGFALMWLALSAVPAFADGPATAPAGLPFPLGQPWPAAHPLSIGERFSPSLPAQSFVPVNPQPQVVPTPTQVPVPSKPVAPPPAPAANVSAVSDPMRSLEPSNTWQVIDPGSATWHKIGFGGVHMDVVLEVDPAGSLTMDVFPPGDFNRAIGQGTPNKGDTSRLVWAGGHWRAQGDWMARITNNTSVAVRYKLTSSANDVSNKSCYGYWEWIGADHVWWTVCN